MEELAGLVDHIVYHNEENGYTVLELIHDGEEMVCIGSLPTINEGEYIKASGEYVDHPVYGRQFQIRTYVLEIPEDEASIERYLGSGMIRGVGPKLAHKIVSYFSSDTFRVLEEEPERLAEIKGISERKALDIGRQFHDKQDMRYAVLFLSKYGISSTFAIRIYNQYGSGLYDILRENPYQLADDIRGIGFRLADEIAAKAGISGNSEYRIRSGIIYVLQQAMGSGHTCLPLPVLTEQTAHLLDIDASFVEKHLEEMGIDKKIVVKTMPEGPQMVYAASYYYMEVNAARKLLELNVTYEISEILTDQMLRKIEEAKGVNLDDMQRYAVLEAVRHGVMIITGGPGTGKTTTINMLITYFEFEGLEICLAAPTGRAAKRMSEAAGRPAATIHRLLEVCGGPGEDGAGEDSQAYFGRNEQNPLEADVIIIDEMSMVDIHLMNALLKAILPGTRLILVGDVNQLPSVGPGNVLKDLIYSHCFCVVMLTKIFRQALTSAIVTNAHRIHAGIPLDPDQKTTDFFCMKRYDAASVTGVLIALIRDKLPRHLGVRPEEIQVLTPMRKGELGVEKLNQVLQQYLNPAKSGKREMDHREGIFREGDKVMQIRNNYQLEWEIVNAYGLPVEKGTGVFNGDTGTIREINTFAQVLTVEYEEGKRVTYAFSQLDELELAYAITIHKSQGSEYPAVILPLLSGPKLLFNRNLLYTAVTRAKKCVVLVGNEQTINQMIANESEQRRYSGLLTWLCQMQEDGVRPGRPLYPEGQANGEY